MKLEEALTLLIRNKGINSLKSTIGMNILNDFNAFKEFPAAKNILKNIVSEGYFEKVCFFINNNLPLDVIETKYSNELYNLYGFRRDIVDYVLKSLVQSIKSLNPPGDIIYGSLGDWFKDFGIISKPDIRIASVCYDNTDIQIRYIKLPFAIKGFNFMTISKAAYAQTITNPDFLKTGEVAFDPEYGWKVQLPSQSNKDELDFNW